MFRTNIVRMREWECCLCLRRRDVNDYNQDLDLAIKSVHSNSDLYFSKMYMKSSGNKDSTIIQKAGATPETSKIYLKALENDCSSNSSSVFMNYQGVKNYV